VDYAFNRVERYRVASRVGPWRVWQAHTLRLIPPGVTYWELCRPGVGQPLSDVAFVSFLGGEAMGLDKLVHPRARYALFLDPEEIVGPLLAEMARIGRDLGEDGYWQAQSLFCTLLDWLLKSEPVEGEIRRIGRIAPTGKSARSDFIQAANAYLEQHLGEPVELAQLARHLHVSASSLSHRYRQEMGVSPMAHLQHLRIRQAKTMLLAGHKLASVAEALQFSDICHISRTFKQMEGVIPRVFLAGMRRGEGVERIDSIGDGNQG
jgi:AraC-like DNA-binding protein